MVVRTVIRAVTVRERKFFILMPTTKFRSLTITAHTPARYLMTVAQAQQGLLAILLGYAFPIRSAGLYYLT